MDVWGCCVSRDTFNIANNDLGFDINYISACSFPVQFSIHSKSIPQEIIDEVFEGKPNSFKKWCTYDLNKSIVDLLDHSESEWLIVDMRITHSPILKVDFNGVIEYYTDDLFDEKKDIFDKMGPYTLTRISSEELENEFEKFTEYCKKRYGKNIILIETFESICALDYEGKLDRTYRLTSNEEERYAISSKMNYRFLKKTGCHYIKCPLNVISDSIHKWGFSPVHYISEYYKYVFECITHIIDGASDSISFDLDVMYAECVSKIALIRKGDILSSRNTLMRIEEYVKEEKFDEAQKLLVEYS